ncbi:MAG: endonuclease/exonuclease/phosphatase family protein [Bdellovibrionota bacterium]
MNITSRASIAVAVSTIFTTLLFTHTPAALASALAAEPGRTQFKVLTYNVKGLPEVFGGYDNKHRFNEIGKVLGERRAQKTAPQIVLIQEAFVDRTANINAEAKYPFSVKGPNSKAFGTEKNRLFGAGLIILSEYPFEKTDNTPFESGDCAGWDCFANKGVQVAEVKIDGMPFVLPIFNTHLQASKEECDARIGQMKTLKTFITEKTSYDRPFLMAGDFNITPGQKSFDWWANESGLENVSIGCTTSNAGCEIEPETDPESLLRVDLHFFFRGIVRSANDPLSTFRVEIRPVRIAKTFKEVVRGKKLSDHLGVEVDYEVNWTPVGYRLGKN